MFPLKIKVFFFKKKRPESIQRQNSSAVLTGQQQGVSYSGAQGYCVQPHPRVLGIPTKPQTDSWLKSPRSPQHTHASSIVHPAVASAGVEKRAFEPMLSCPPPCWKYCTGGLCMGCVEQQCDRGQDLAFVVDSWLYGPYREASRRWPENPFVQDPTPC